MAGLNKVMLIGRLGDGPEMRYTQNGSAVANMRIATDESYKDNNGEWQKKTEWHKAVAFAAKADLAQKYLHKGSQVFIEGRLQTRQWEDNNGNKRYTTEIVVKDMVFLCDGKSNSNQANQSGYNTNTKPKTYKQASILDEESSDFSSSIDDEEYPF